MGTVTAGAADATATAARGATGSKVLHRLRVEPGKAAGIAERDPRETFGLNWLKALLVAELLAAELERLDPRFPS